MQHNCICFVLLLQSRVQYNVINRWGDVGQAERAEMLNPKSYNLVQYGFMMMIDYTTLNCSATKKLIDMLYE